MRATRSCGSSSGDARRALTALEAAASLAGPPMRTTTPARPEITAEHVAQAVDRALLRYDRQGDEHYDVISAFIKSIRGSDVDAAMHYLARMIEAGEDPRFIARRLIISAAEDIGLADPQALPLAVAAADAVQLIGMPEGRIPLAEATVYLATTAKSNAAYSPSDAAIADVAPAASGACRRRCATRTTRGEALGHGKGYVYPHDREVGVVAQQHLPDELRGAPLLRADEPPGQERDVQAAAREDPAPGILDGEPNDRPTVTAARLGSAGPYGRSASTGGPRLIDLTGSKPSFRASPLFSTNHRHAPTCARTRRREGDTSVSRERHGHVIGRNTSWPRSPRTAARSACRARSASR